jgi:hypothetical protein
MKLTKTDHKYKILVGVIRNASSNHVCGHGLDMAQPFFGALDSSSLMHCQQSMMGLTSLPLHLTIKKPLPLLQPSHTPAMLQHTSNAIAIVSTSIATTETVRIGWSLSFQVFDCSFFVVVLPLLSQTHPCLPAHRLIEQLPLPSTGCKNSKEQSYSEFCYFKFCSPNASAPR